MEISDYIANRTSLEDYERFLMYKQESFLDNFDRVTLIGEAGTGEFAMIELAKRAMSKGCDYVTNIHKLSEMQGCSAPRQSETEETQRTEGKNLVRTVKTQFVNDTSYGRITLAGIGFIRKSR